MARFRNSPYDLVIEINGRFLRGRSYKCHLDSNGHAYSPDQIDFIAAYIIPTDTWYILPIRPTKAQPDILLTPPGTAPQHPFNDAAFQWLRARRAIVVDLDTTNQRGVMAILATHPRLVGTRKNRSSGDPFVIALAQARGLSVVTGEKPSGVLAKPYIPDVCAALRIPWMSVLSMFRQEGWKA